MEKKKYAVITGATKGIGRAITERFLGEGYHVIGVYASDDEAAQTLLSANNVYQGRLILIKMDIANYKSAIELARLVRERCSELDVLVLNSGTTDRTPFGEITEESWMRVMNVNINAPFFLIQALSEQITADTGRIILIGSLLGGHPHAMSVSYGVSKAAVHALAAYLVKYFSPRGITVNAVVPGFTDTPWQSGKDPTLRKRIEEKIALHRFARPEEIASLCMYLLENQYINGAVLPIDGGYNYQ